jgi:hypothetical protein
VVVAWPGGLEPSCGLQDKGGNVALRTRNAGLRVWQYSDVECCNPSLNQHSVHGRETCLLIAGHLLTCS